MAGFTPEEIEDVIDRLVNSSIRRPYDTLGARRTDITFSDVQGAAAGVFLLYQRTPYYFASLGTSRLEGEVQDVAGQIDAIVGLLDVLRRRVVPVRDISSLANARSALFELESAVSKNGPPRDVTKVPAYQRFNSNIDRFLGQVGSNIKSAGQVVPTPSEARGQIPAAVSALQDAMTLLVQRVTYVSDALKDYGSINLPALVSGGVIAKARQMLDTRVTELEAMSETDRLDVLRDTVLECLGTKAVVKRFGSFTPPGSLADLTGTGLPFSDTERPAFEAYLDADKYGPYALVPGSDASTSTNVLNLWADGAASYPSAPTTQFFLPPSMYANIQGQRSGPYNIVAGTNNAMQVRVNGVSYPFSLTAGSTQSAAQVVADITAGLTATNFKGEAYFAPLMFDGEVQVAGNNLTLAFGSFPANSVNVGDEVDFYFGTGAPTTRTVTAVTPSVANPQTITVGGASLGAGTSRIRYGSANRMVRIVPKNRLLSIQNKETIQLETPTTVQQNAGITLGMFGTLVAYSTPTDAELVAQFITANSTRFRAETLFAPSFPGISLRSEPSDSFTLVAYETRGNASWGAGTTVVLTFDAAFDYDPTGLAVCLREGLNPNAVGTVVAWNAGDHRQVTVDFGLTTISAASGIVEVGPASGISSGMVVNVAIGPNAGKYFVDTVHSTIPFQFKARSVVPLFRDGFNQPAFMVGDVGLEGVRFFSKTTNLTSKIEIRDPLNVFMNTTGPTSAVGTTKYFKLPSKPNDLEVGDFLQFFTTGLEEADFERVIETLYDDTVVALDGAIDSTNSWPFNVTTTPMARLRTDKVVSFDEYSAKLKTWLLGSEVNVRSYFIDLNRFIQPLLVNQNPTDTDIGAAEGKLRELQGVLTLEGAATADKDPALSLESLLNSYSAPYVAEADALIKAYIEKGADRAIDVLLDCRFTSFFGMDQDELSYAGNFQKTTRSVAATDLPVRKTDRDAALQSPLQGTSASPDYELDSSDLDETPNIDPPVNSIG